VSCFWPRSGRTVVQREKRVKVIDRWTMELELEEPLRGGVHPGVRRRTHAAEPASIFNLATFLSPANSHLLPSPPCPPT
jgi:hypothetical protein